MSEVVSKLVAGRAQTRVGFPGIEVGDALTLTANNSGYLVYQVTSGRKFKLGTVIITNDRASNITIDLFDCTSALSNRLLHVIAGAEKTEVYPPDELLGVRESISGIYATTTLSGTVVHVGGFEN